MQLSYTPNGALHHLLTGIKAMIAKDAAASCTWHSLHAWTRLTPCAAEPVELSALLDRLAADGHILVTATGAAGLSAGDYTSARVSLLGSGLLKISALNLQRINQPAPRGEVAGRKALLSGQPNPLDRPPVLRAGADQCSTIQSRTGDTFRQYDASQGMGKGNAL